MRFNFTKIVLLNLATVAVATQNICGYNEHKHLLGLGTHFVQDDNDNCYKVVFGEYILQGHIDSSENGKCDSTVNFGYFVGAFDWEESNSTDKFEYRLGSATDCDNDEHRRATFVVHEDKSVSVPTFEVKEPSVCRYRINLKIQNCEEASISMVEDASVIEGDILDIPIVVGGTNSTNNVSISITKEPEIGTVEVSGGTNLIYKHTGVGTDSFVYTVCDVNTICKSANMTIAVIAIYGYEDNVPEAEDYLLLYDLDIPDRPNWNLPNLPEYSYGSTPFKDYTRVAYWMELQSKQDHRHEWVWVSVPKFEDDYRRLGIPVFATDFTYNELQSEANVYTNKKDIASDGALENVTVNFEFWPFNYGTHNEKSIPGASNDVYDFGDQKHTASTYGSFQVHVPSIQGTLFAINGWGIARNSALDIGIGNQPTGHPDWTYANNGDTYTLKNLAVLVMPAPEGRAVEPTNLAANLDDAQGYKLIYSLNIPDRPDFYDHLVPYSTDYSIFHPNGSFERVAYYLELTKDGDTEWVWVSMNTFTDDAKKLGVPTRTSKAAFQEFVEDMNIYSNVDRMQASGISGGVEFWPYGYQTQDALDIGASEKYHDYGDSMYTKSNYGSMQIYARVLGHGINILSFNGWSYNKNLYADIGIGENENGDHPDWSYARNANEYAVKKLEVFIK